MFVIAVSNHKAGAGKTTTSLALATCLALRGQRVLAVDLDPQGSLGMHAGVFTSEGCATTGDMIRGSVSAEDASRALGHPGLETLRVVPADVRLLQIEGWLRGKVGYDSILEDRLASAAEAFDFVVLDCPSSLGALTLNAIVAADVVLAPTQCEFVSARGAVAVQEMVGLIREIRRPELSFRVVPTFYDPRDRSCRRVLGRLRRDFAASMSKVTIGVDGRVKEAQGKGIPSRLFTPDSRASLAYEALTLELELVAARRSLIRIAA